MTERRPWDRPSEKNLLTRWTEGADRSKFAADFAMSSSAHPLVRRLMLVCMVALGLQLCFPLSLQANALASQVDMISLGVKDPSDKPGVQVDLDVPVAAVVLLTLVLAPQVAVVGTTDTEAVVLPAMLPVAGYHPSAP